MDHIIDASGQKLGRLASRVASILQGKDRPGYAPNRILKDRVVIKNVSRIATSGGKADQKIYYRHTGYMGHLREKPFREAFAQSPERVFHRAVYNMLPKNFLRSRRLTQLKIER